MTIDEAIALERQAGEEQIAKWLEELKTLKENSVSKEAFENMKSKAHNHGYRQGYAKAIDDFVKCIDECSGWTQNCIEHNIGLTVYTLHQIAEQLKETNK